MKRAMHSFAFCSINKTLAVHRSFVTFILKPTFLRAAFFFRPEEVKEQVELDVARYLSVFGVRAFEFRYCIYGMRKPSVIYGGI